MRAAHTLFAALFAVAQLLHQLWWHGFELTSPRSAIVAAAVWLLVRPSSVARFALLLGVLVVVLAADLPFVMSHLLVVLVVGVTVLAQLAVVALRGRPPAAETLTPFLRATLLITYLVAGVAKLNTAFLDPATSCAGPMTATITWFSPGLLASPQLVGPAIVGTVVVELGLPLLLAVPRTRVVGLVVGGGFHLVLAAAGNVPFTALAFALYALFLPPDAADRLVAWFPPATRWAALVLVPGWIGGAALTASHPAVAQASIANGTRLAVAAIALAGAAALLVADRTPVPSALRMRSPILVVGLLALLLNGASPYLGFKTESSLEMFSALRTEPGGWNHVLLPETMRVGTLQEPLRVVDGEPGLVARTAGPIRIVRGEVERVLRARSGAVAVVEDRTGSRDVVGPFPGGPTVADRVAWYRDVTPPWVPRC